MLDPVTGKLKQMPSVSDIGAATSAQGTEADNAIKGVQADGEDLAIDANKKVNVTAAKLGIADYIVESGASGNSSILPPQAAGLDKTPWRTAFAASFTTESMSATMSASVRVPPMCATVKTWSSSTIHTMLSAGTERGLIYITKCGRCQQLRPLKIKKEGLS